MKLTFAFTLALIFFLAGCSQKEPVAPIKLETNPKVSKAKLKEVPISSIQGFYQDDLNKALEVFKKDCKRSQRFELFKSVCQKAQDSTNGQEFFTQNFTAYELYNKDNTNKGLVTGYYEPLLNGSRTKSDKYKYPIYKVPKDMVIVDLTSIYPELKKYRLRGKIKDNKLIPYDDREAIGKRDDIETIAYVDDEIDLFFLQIQGSGRVLLDNGELINVGYANQNGHKYHGIGGSLLKEGVLKGYGASMQGIKKYLEANPQRVDEVLNRNRSYIFFIENKKTATGALGTELVAQRNIAVDRRYVPLGMPVFINTRNSVTKENINRLVVAADVGGAIKGEIRADYYYGYGKDAALWAGGMKSHGTLTILVPNDFVNKEVK